MQTEKQELSQSFNSWTLTLTNFTALDNNLPELSSGGSQL